MIDELIVWLANRAPTAEAQELADAVWLASLDVLVAVPRAEATNNADCSDTKPTKAFSRPSRPAATGAPTARDSAVASVQVAEETLSKSRHGLALRTPSGRALPGAREISRALRPLCRRVPARTVSVLDEVLTVQHVAETDVWMPVLVPDRSRWLEVALVVDESPSLAIWHDVLIELRRLLEQMGAFRDIRLWRMDTSRADSLTLRSGSGGPGRTPGQLLVHDARRLVIVMSDCTTPAWDSGQVGAVLSRWGSHQPTAILQMLPASFWRRTALDPSLGSVWVELGSHGIGVPNQRLRRRLWRARPGTPAPRGIPIPVFTTGSRDIANWVGLLTGVTATRVPGVLWNTVRYGAIPRVPTVNGTSVQGLPAASSAVERLLAFQTVASPEAMDLARLLAAAPLRLPVMRLVQQVLLPWSRQIHLAEVFLSGLLVRVSPTGVTDPHLVDYDFLPGVREALLDSTDASEPPQVQQLVSDYLHERLNRTVGGFVAVVPVPGLIGGLPVPTMDREFARIQAKVLGRLGGQYQDAARKLLEAHKQETESHTLEAQTVDQVEQEGGPSRQEVDRQAEHEADHDAQYEAELAQAQADHDAEHEADRRAELARLQADYEAEHEAERQAELAELQADHDAEREAERQAELAEFQADHDAELEVERQAELAELQADHDAEREAERQAELAELQADHDAELEAERQAELAELQADHDAEREAERQAELAELQADHDAELEAERQAELAQVQADHDAELEAERQAELAQAAVLHLLLSLFGSADEFRRWILVGSYGRELVAEFPGGSAGPSSVISGGLDVLGRHGLLNADFFARLTADFPRQRDAITQAATTWGVLSLARDAMIFLQRRFPRAPIFKKTYPLLSGRSGHTNKTMIGFVAFDFESGTKQLLFATSMLGSMGDVRRLAKDLEILKTDLEQSISLVHRQVDDPYKSQTSSNKLPWNGVVLFTDVLAVSTAEIRSAFGSVSVEIVSTEGRDDPNIQSAIEDGWRHLALPDADGARTIFAEILNRVGPQKPVAAMLGMAVYHGLKARDPWAARWDSYMETARSEAARQHAPIELRRAIALWFGVFSQFAGRSDECVSALAFLRLHPGPASPFTQPIPHVIANLVKLMRPRGPSTSRGSRPIEGRNINGDERSFVFGLRAYLRLAVSMSAGSSLPHNDPLWIGLENNDGSAVWLTDEQKAIEFVRTQTDKARHEFINAIRALYAELASLADQRGFKCTRGDDVYMEDYESQGRFKVPGIFTLHGPSGTLTLQPDTFVRTLLPAGGFGGFKSIFNGRSADICYHLKSGRLIYPDSSIVNASEIIKQVSLAYRTLLHILTADGVLMSTQVANLSSFPATGELVALADARVFEVFHPVLRATIEPQEPGNVPDDALSALLLKPAADGGSMTASREVGGGPQALPIRVQLYSELFPTGVWRFVPRPLAIHDGVDIEMRDSPSNSMVGHHVIAGPTGLVLRQATMLVDYEPVEDGGRRRWRLPK